MQVAGDLAVAGKQLGARVLTIYGGRAYEPQIEALRKGIDVVVGTPGRLLDLAQQGHLVLGNVRILVLDEADEMLDLGFLPDIEKLLKLVPAKRQTMLFSATMPGPIVALARTFLNQPIQIRAEHGAEHTAHRPRRPVRLPRARDGQGRAARPRAAGPRPRTDADLHPHQADRREGRRRPGRRAASRPPRCTATSARAPASRRCGHSAPARSTCSSPPTSPPAAWTSRASRHVINYQAPEDEMTYVHRIGRTARAGKPGNAITLVDWDDVPRWKLICDKLDLPLHEPVETYSTSPHLYLELDIPADATGVLPRTARTRAGLDAEAARGPRRAGFPGASKRQPRPGPRGPGTCSSRRRAPRRGR